VIALTPRFDTRAQVLAEDRRSVEPNWGLIAMLGLNTLSWCLIVKLFV
jgi:hypothetical protein